MKLLVRCKKYVLFYPIAQWAKGVMKYIFICLGCFENAYLY